MWPRSTTSQVAKQSSVLLSIDRHSVNRVERLAHGLVERGMRMDGVDQRLNGGLRLHRQHALADQLVSLRADNVDAQDLPVFLIGDNFHKAVMLPQDRSLGVGGEGEFSD